MVLDLRAEDPMKKKKLELNRDTIKTLIGPDAERAAGAGVPPTSFLVCTDTCSQPTVCPTENVTVSCFQVCTTVSFPICPSACNECPTTLCPTNNCPILA